MKAMVLAAGKGIRLLPHTQIWAKPAFPFFGIPLVQLVLGRLIQAGITEAVLNLHHLPETVIHAAKDAERLGIKVSFTYENKILGTSGGLKNAERYFDGCGSLLMTNCDILLDADITSLIDFHKRNQARATMLLYKGVGSQNYPQIGVDSNNRIVFFIDRSYDSNSQIAQSGSFTGVHVFDERIFAEA